MDSPQQRFQKRLLKLLTELSHSVLAEILQGGSLIQIWMSTEGGTLCTFGMPFCISAAGGDLLALYRCASARYTFSSLKTKTDRNLVERAYLNLEVIMSTNTSSDLSESSCPRFTDATHCLINALLIFPIFEAPPSSVHVREGSGSQPLAVVEVVTVDRSSDMKKLLERVNPYLEAAGFCSVRPSGSAGECTGGQSSAEDQNLLQQPSGTLSELSDMIRPRQGPLTNKSKNKVSSVGAPGEVDTDSKVEEEGQDIEQEMEVEEMKEEEEEGEEEVEEDEKEEEEEEVEDHQTPGDDSEGLHVGEGPSGSGGNKISKGGPNPRAVKGSGVSLRYLDLQAQFGVGLRKAAENLGVSATTLKRACRRHGIKRWPCRTLAKLNKNASYVTIYLGGVPPASSRHGITVPLPSNTTLISTTYEAAVHEPAVRHVAPSEIRGQTSMYADYLALQQRQVDAVHFGGHGQLHANHLTMNQGPSIFQPPMQEQPNAVQLALSRQQVNSLQSQHKIEDKAPHELEELMAEARALEMQAHLMHLQSQMMQRSLEQQQQQITE
ncbi:hypothetical protein CEUSTIGMA_g1295.t1 [Chlamydomonas eustigma]|uniref:RWP-RK domain-containing protein n=1 Tax=Chlamydomonas eustigma TaxID=1157962 RepID=A0A250WSP8_9CHLO|nr:hypothetical protein CEUSTIGMA_g1295.t1 [Chlamydomonas eustigma]|eukprot:GAX73845.1 hypothetical protein CEUSTIGMA_g1295.t1 [Chlamydomonas eustigma]